MLSASFLDNIEIETLLRRHYSFKHLYADFFYLVVHINNWDHFTQNVIVFQLSTLWYEHRSATLALSKLVTFCLDPQCSSDQCKESSIEHDSSIAVQWHIHGDKALWNKEEKENSHTLSGLNCSSLLMLP